MFKIISILFVILLSSGTAYALDVTSAAVGYVVGKSGGAKQTVVNGGVDMGVLPFDCTLSDGRCITLGGKKSIPVAEVCSIIGKDYKPVGFKKVGTYASDVIILCKKVRTGCAKCHY
jgi:hypothetical protein